MPSEQAGLVQLEYTPEFKRNLRTLAKKYKHIRLDVQPVIYQLQSGEVIGKQVPRTHYSQGTGAEQRYSERQTFWLSLDLSPQGTDTNNPCDNLFQVGPGGRLGGAD
jgi:hypothetical protein